MALEEFEFKTKDEALAFIKGVEYVNDSAITVRPAPLPQKQDGPEYREPFWYVTLEDEDGKEED